MQWYKPIVYGDKPGGRSAHSASLIDDRYIHIFGGWNGDEELGDLRILDTETLSWSSPFTQGVHPSPRHFHSSSPLKHFLYIFGGYDGDDWRNDTMQLDLNTMVWKQIIFTGSVPPVRASHSSTVIGENKILVFGGYDGNKFLNDMWLLETTDKYSSPSHRWIQIGTKRSEIDMWPRARSGHTSSFISIKNCNFVLLFGGRHKDGRCNELLCLETDNMKWIKPKVSGKFPSPRKTHAAAIVNDKLFVLGGHDGDRPLGKVVHVLQIINLWNIPKEKYSIDILLSYS